MEENKKLTLSSPWINYYRELETLFGRDEEIKMDFNEEENLLKLYVSDGDKAHALEKLLPEEVMFGNVIFRIEVIPPNLDEMDTLSLFEKAFENNPVFVDVMTSKVLGCSFNYVLFAREVVQYFNDDISDANRVKSTLYQEIAKDVFKGIEGVNFCTSSRLFNGARPHRSSYVSYPCKSAKEDLARRLKEDFGEPGDNF